MPTASQFSIRSIVELGTHDELIARNGYYTISTLPPIPLPAIACRESV